MASFAMFQNECRSRFAASDLEQSSKEKKPIVTV